MSRRIQNFVTHPTPPLATFDELHDRRRVAALLILNPVEAIVDAAPIEAHERPDLTFDDADGLVH
jgi:hypothetical protein